MSLSTEITKNVFIASLLHDIGAITVEEKISLHDFENISLDKHCLRGELLLKRIPEFVPIAEIVKNHHKEWQEWNDPLEEIHVISSQIVLLADYIERLIDRKQYILHQPKNIIERVKSISSTLVNPQLIKYFLEYSNKEEFLTRFNITQIILTLISQWTFETY